MTDRVKGLVVTLDKDIRDDDAQVIVDAISLIRGVARVKMSVSNHQDYMNRSRIKSEIYEKISVLLRDEE